MFAIGKYNQLQVRKIDDAGAYLDSAAGDVIVPLPHVPAGTKPGDTLNVFVYRDAVDRLAATTIAPKAQVGEFAVLEVTDNSRVGSFLDWGLDKDLLVPFSEQPVPMKKRESYVVRVYLDKAGRIAASARIDKFLETGNIPLKFGEEVDLMIYQFTDLGAKVIINDRYPGLLFKNELYGKPALGARLKGYISKVREDRKIDVTLRKSGAQGMAGDREMVLQALAAAGGFLPLGDKSHPRHIEEALKMSKKTFKKVIGNLYKDEALELTQEGIRLKMNDNS
jgi:predicted RNA-binding protein (virulence factor B family)